MMSDFDFSFDEWAEDDQSALDNEEIASPPENYCAIHDVFDCWFAHHEVNTVDDVDEAISVAESDPREAEIDALMTKVKELESKVNAFDTEFTEPLQSRMSDIHKEKLKAADIYKQLVAELDREYADKFNALREARNERAALQYELDRITKEQQNLIKSMATEKMLKDIEDKLDFIVMGAPWYESARKYQMDDLKFMVAAFESGKTGVLNANPTGMGKTFESIMLDYCLQHLFPQKYSRSPLVLWVTISSLIAQTVREIKRFNPSRYVVPIEGSWPAGMRETAVQMALETGSPDNPRPPALVIVNYEQLNTNRLLLDTEWDVIIADEVSKLKGGANPSKPTRVWTNFQRMLWETQLDRYGNVHYTDKYDPIPRAKFFVPLSGTPIQNKPGDMWAYLHLFKPTKFGTLKNFEREYAYGWPDIPINPERIINIMKDQVVRQDKEKELDLPPKVYEFREVELTENQRKVYDQMKTYFYTWLDSKGEQEIQASAVVAWITRLWQIAVFPGQFKFMTEDEREVPSECQESAVLDEAEELVENIIAEDGRAVVFSARFNPPLYALQKRLAAKGINAAVISGDQSNPERDASIVSYDSDDKGSVQVLLCNMHAAGYGLNLQKARQAVFLDQWWNPAVQEQAEDRIHRPRADGSKPTIVIHKIQAINTVYSFILEKAMAKADMANSIMESKEFRKGSNWKDYLEGMI